MKKILLCVVIFCYSDLYAQLFTEDNQIIFNEFQQNDSIKKASIGKEFNDFKAMTLEGDSVFKNNLIGKVTVVSIWFVTCAPCIAEFEELSILYNKYKDNINFQFLSFTTDSYEVAIKAVEKYNIPYPVCPIPKEKAYQMNFKAGGFPTKFIISREGKIVFFKTGGFIEQEKVVKDIKELEDIIIKLLL